MDKREAQQQGAADKAAGRASKDQEMVLAYEDWEVIIFYAHGYFQGHGACTCEMLLGGHNINAQVLAADGEVAPQP